MGKSTKTDQIRIQVQLVKKATPQNKKICKTSEQV